MHFLTGNWGGQRRSGNGIQGDSEAEAEDELSMIQLGGVGLSLSTEAAGGFN